MNQKNLLKKSLLAINIMMLSPLLSAAGFQLNEHSSAGLGRAFSGEGVMKDTAASAGRNPAAMMMFDRPIISTGATYLDVAVHIDGQSKIGNDLDVKNIVPRELVPNLHYIQPMNDKWALGVSVTSNFGLSTKFAEDYAAGMLAGSTKLTTGNFNINTAYRLNPHFSLGAGINTVYTKAKIVRHAGEIADSVPTLNLTRDSEIARLEGTKWGYGWNFGLLYELDDANRFSLTYRSKIDIHFKGNYSNQFHHLSNGNIPGLPQGTDNKKITGYLDLVLPEIWEFSAYHQVSSQWAVHYGLTYTGWSRFQELHGRDIQGNELFHKDEGFTNSARISIGTTYDYDKIWTFRTGIAFDDSATSGNNRSISIPDQDRFWLSAGTTYHLSSNTSIDLGISYMRGQKVSFSEKSITGSYDFTAKGTALLYGLNMNYIF